jgi:hypothetical protein
MYKSIVRVAARMKLEFKRANNCSRPYSSRESLPSVHCHANVNVNVDLRTQTNIPTKTKQKQNAHENTKQQIPTKM